MVRRLTVALVLLAVCMAVTARAQAQTRYTPRSPTISPYMNMWQKNTGPFDNYNSNVRPQIELRDIIQQQEAGIQQNQQNIRNVEGQLGRQATRAPSTPTGTGAVYMQYSHYYNLSGRSAGKGARR